jgi:hypothetical protein
MTITLMLLLSNTHLLASTLSLPATDRNRPTSGFVTTRPSEVEAVRDDDSGIDVRQVEDERPYAL